MMQLMTMCDCSVNHNCMLLIGIRFVEDKWPKWQSDQLAGHPSLSTLEKLKIKKKHFVYNVCMRVCVCVHIYMHGGTEGVKESNIIIIIPSNNWKS